MKISETQKKCLWVISYGVWEKPKEGHRYILGCDVSRGDSEDFTSIIIIDFDEKCQVLEYLGKIPPDLAADIVYKWGSMYNAYVVTDITGGMGVRYI